MSTTIRLPRDPFDWVRECPEWAQDCPAPAVPPADVRTAIYDGANRLAKAGAR